VVEPIDAFEKEVREQLQERPAPPGFAERVMARIPVKRPRRLLWQPIWRWAAVAAVVAVTVFGGVEHEREQRIAGEHAREQVLLALRITGSTLHQVQNKVSQSSSQEAAARPKATIDLAP